MNKQEAAQFLGVSVRTLESYAAQNRVVVNYIRGKTRPVADFDEADLERLKDELAPPGNSANSAATSQNSEIAQNSANRAAIPQKPAKNLAANSETSQSAGLSALARTESGAPNGAVLVIEASHLQELLQAALSTNPETPQHLAAKMLLTLSEAQTLTGLSRETLKSAMDAGELPAQRIGKAWRLRPEDVREWLKQKFQTSK